jgi:hypothetical protein
MKYLVFLFVFCFLTYGAVIGFDEKGRWPQKLRVALQVAAILTAALVALAFLAQLMGGDKYPSYE